MPHPLVLAALAGLASAGLFLLLVSGVPGVLLFAYFVQLPVIFSGLTLGLTGSVVAALSAVLVNSLIAGLLASLIYAVLQAGPALFLVRQALLSRTGDDGQVEWFPPGLLLAQLTLLAVLAVVLAYGFYLGEPGGLQGAVESFLAVALSEFGAIPSATELPPEVQGLAFLFPGVMATSWLVMVVLNGVLAQALAVRSGWQRRPTPDLAGLELPWWLWPILGLAALFSLFGGGLGFLGGSLLMIMAVPYFFLGLAVVHSLARQWSHRRVALFVLYACIVLFGWPGLVVVLLGFVEDWAHLRRRLV